jgi:predicted DCC family thiol-disulfide oxidoreductase YuxK
MAGKEILIVYDKQCPACDYYCSLVRIKKSVGTLKLVDAREASSVMDEITEMGLDIDQGMVLKVDGQIYYGPDAIHAISLLGTRSGFFNRVNFWVFRSKRMSKILYPIFKACRNILLKVLRITKVNNLALSGNDYF